VNKPIKIKIDNRFRDGNIRVSDNEVRGNAKTVAITNFDDVTGAPQTFRPNAPLVVSSAMFEALKKAGFLA
jgi:hypothetical protein